jgi:hypothetical protein
MIFNTFFNYAFICKKQVLELRIFGTTEYRVTFRNNDLQLVTGRNETYQKITFRKKLSEKKSSGKSKTLLELLNIYTQL